MSKLEVPRAKSKKRLREREILEIEATIEEMLDIEATIHVLHGRLGKLYSFLSGWYPFRGSVQDHIQYLKDKLGLLRFEA